MYTDSSTSRPTGIQLHYSQTSLLHASLNHRPIHRCKPLLPLRISNNSLRRPPLEYWRGAWSFLEINISVGKMGEINKWPQDLVEINILPTLEVKINII